MVMRNSRGLLLTLCIFLLYGSGHSLDEEGSQYTNTWVVELESGLTNEQVTELASKEGFINHGEVRKRFVMVYQTAAPFSWHVVYCFLLTVVFVAVNETVTI